MPRRALEKTTHTGITAEHERRLRRHAVPSVQSIPFTYSGAVAVSSSPPWVADTDVTLRKVRALLGTAGTSDTVVTVYKNGSSLGVLTLTSGDTNVAEDFAVSFAADTDLLTVAVTTAGTGAADLDVIARVG